MSTGVGPACSCRVWRAGYSGRVRACPGPLLAFVLARSPAGPGDLRIGVEVSLELVLVALPADKDEPALLRHTSRGQVVDVAGEVGPAKVDVFRCPGEERVERTGCDALSAQVGGDVVRYVGLVADWLKLDPAYGFAIGASSDRQVELFS